MFLVRTNNKGLGLCSGGVDSGLMGAASGWLHRSSMSHGKHLFTPVARSLDVKAADLWLRLRHAATMHKDGNVRLPDSRTMTLDWVRDGVHMRR